MTDISVHLQSFEWLYDVDQYWSAVLEALDCGSERQDIVFGEMMLVVLAEVVIIALEADMLLSSYKRL